MYNIDKQVDGKSDSRCQGISRLDQTCPVLCRCAGIGTPEAIRLVWSCHREVINDYGPVPTDTSTYKTT